jgi:hypothetical protein
MAIFAIFRLANPAKVKDALERHYPGQFLEVAPSVFLLSAKGHPKDISDKLEISDGETGAAIIFRMATFYGRATTDIWDWITSKAEKSDG